MISNDVTQNELNEDTTIVLDLWQTCIANVFWFMWAFVIVGVTSIMSKTLILYHDNPMSVIYACFVAMLLMYLVRETPTVKFHYMRRLKGTRILQR